MAAALRCSRVGHKGTRLGSAAVLRQAVCCCCSPNTCPAAQAHESETSLRRVSGCRLQRNPRAEVQQAGLGAAGSCSPPCCTFWQHLYVRPHVAMHLHLLKPRYWHRTCKLSTMCLLQQSLERISLLALLDYTASLASCGEADLAGTAARGGDRGVGGCSPLAQNARMRSAILASSTAGSSLKKSHLWNVRMQLEACCCTEHAMDGQQRLVHQAVTTLQQQEAQQRLHGALSIEHCAAHLSSMAS